MEANKSLSWWKNKNITVKKKVCLASLISSLVKVIRYKYDHVLRIVSLLNSQLDALLNLRKKTTTIHDGYPAIIDGIHYVSMR